MSPEAFILLVIVAAPGIYLLGDLVLRRVPAWFARRAQRRAYRRREAQRTLRVRDEFFSVDTPALVRRAVSALAELDEELRAAQQAVPHADALLGPDLARELEAAVSTARAAQADAHRARSGLEDVPDDDERALRDVATRVLRACRAGTAPLREQRAALAEAGALATGVASVLDALAVHAARARDRAVSARRDLAALVDRFPPDALSPFVRDLDRVDSLLAEADDALTRGRARAVAGARQGAVGCVRVAQDALAQVAELLTPAVSAEVELEAAVRGLDAGVASLSADLADVERLAPDDPQVVTDAGEARAALVVAEAARSGAGDPRAAVRRLTAAETALDASLAPHRDDDEQRRRDAVLVDAALTRLEVALLTTRGIVGPRRGVTASGAHRRLDRAEQMHQRATVDRDADPVAAMVDVRHGLELVEEARQIARLDLTARRAAGR